MSTFPSSPFGFDITHTTVLDLMSEAKGWEDRYRNVIQLGKKLPKMPEELQQDNVTISGCESKVWLQHEVIDGVYFFCADSDARIVRGLIALVMAAVNNKTAQEISTFDMDGYFAQLGLIEHLSPSRGNGLKAIIETINETIRSDS